MISVKIMKYIQLKKLFYTDKEHYENIYTTRSTGESTDHLEFSVHKYPALYMINSEVLGLITDIIRQNAVIRDLFKTELPDFARNHYVKECLISEIVRTNEIEGIRSTRAEVRDTLDVLAGQAKQKKNNRMRFKGILNKYLALQSGEKMSLTAPKDIRDIYDQIVLEEVLSENINNAPDGELFRNSPVSVVDSFGRDVHHGSDSERDILRDLEKALRFYNTESTEPLIRICLFHFLFEYIHPFYDGNGRTGRFILSAGLAEELGAAIAYRISGTIYESIKQYYQGFTDSEDRLNRGDLTPFLIMMLNMIRKAQEGIVEEQTAIVYKWKAYREFADRTWNDPREHKIALRLMGTAIFENESVSLKTLAEDTCISEYKVSEVLKKLEKQGLVRHRVNGKKYVYGFIVEKLDTLILP